MCTAVREALIEEGYDDHTLQELKNVKIIRTIYGRKSDLRLFSYFLAMVSESEQFKSTGTYHSIGSGRSNDAQPSPTTTRNDSQQRYQSFDPLE